MATFHGQTVDIWEDFEDSTLETGLTETDTGSIVTIPDTAQHYAGSASMGVAAASGANGYIEYTPGVDNSSIGFWYRTSSLANWQWGPTFVVFGHAAMNRIICVADHYAGTRYLVVQWGSAPHATDSIACANNTWYWVTIQYNRNTTSYVRVYNTAGEQVASVSHSLADYSADYQPYIRWGVVSSDVINSVYFDDAVVDKTDATFPILGWDTSVTVSAQAADGILAGDSSTNAATFRPVASDGASFSDSDISRGILRPISIDGILLSDSDIRRLILHSDISDGITISDAGINRAIYQPVASDGITLSDSNTKRAIFRTEITDGFSMADGDINRGIMRPLASDGVVFSDSPSSLSKLIAAITDGVLFSDYANWLITIQAIASDGIILSDSTNRTLAKIAIASDGITLTDSGISRVVLRAVLSDGITLSDTISVIAKLLASASDGIKLSDTTVELSTLPTGVITITFTTKHPNITFTAREPGVTFAARSPDITFTGGT
jgi:hypothetical protein